VSSGSTDPPRRVRLEQDKVCLLVIIGVRADGTKELVALADGFRESSESWADLLRDCKRRGMRAPVLAVAKITDDLDVLLAFYDFPAEHWIHLRTTNPIHVCHRAAADPGDQGARLEGRWGRDGVQAHRVRPNPVAGRQRTPPGGTGPRQRQDREWQAHRTTRRIGR
jgi:hypothetical protein